MPGNKKVVIDKNGKLTVDGRTMSKATYFKLYGNILKSSSEMYKDVKKVSTTADAAKAAYDKKASKKAAKTIKKVTTVSKKQAAKSSNMSNDSARARKAAADRAMSVPPNRRTPAQIRAIKTQARYKAGLPGYKTIRGGGGGGGSLMWNPKNR